MTATTVAEPMESILTVPRPPDQAERDSAAQWLLGRGDVPAAEVLRMTGLAPYVYTVLPVEHPLRPSLRRDFLASLRRHHEIKQEILPLLAAWRQAGIEVLLFKGFQLAEFVYPLPGARPYSDVDLLIRQGQLERAAQIAHSLGWRQGPSRAARFPGHCAYKLVRVGGGTMLDVHRWALHASLPWAGVQQRVTEAVWRSSLKREWEDIEVREPTPVDALLVGLVLQRCWGDDWRLKPSDFVDFQHLATRAEVEHEALRARARTLRCELTLALFLERCDPRARRLDLSPPDRASRLRWSYAAFRERGLVGQPERMLARVLAAPTRTLVGATFVPTLLRVRLALRRDDDLRKLLSGLTSPEGRVRGRSPAQLKEVVSGVRWAIRLLGTGSYGPCLVRSLTIYAALRRRGWDVEFVSGLRRGGDSVAGHAWVEHEGVVLWDLREPNNRLIYRENFRFPGGVRDYAAEDAAGHRDRSKRATASRLHLRSGR